MQPIGMFAFVTRSHYWLMFYWWPQPPGLFSAKLLSSCSAPSMWICSFPSPGLCWETFISFLLTYFSQGPFLWQHSCPQPPHTFTVALAGSFSSCDTNPPFVKYCEEVLLPKILSNKWNKKISRDPVHQRKLLFHVSKSHFLWIPIINQEKQQCFTERQFSRNLWMLGSGKLE